MWWWEKLSNNVKLEFCGSVYSTALSSSSAVCICPYSETYAAILIGLVEIIAAFQEDMRGTLCYESCKFRNFQIKKPDSSMCVQKFFYLLLTSAYRSTGDEILLSDRSDGGLFKPAKLQKKTAPIIKATMRILFLILRKDCIDWLVVLILLQAIRPDKGLNKTKVIGQVANNTAEIPHVCQTLEVVFEFSTMFKILCLTPKWENSFAKQQENASGETRCRYDNCNESSTSSN